MTATARQRPGGKSPRSIELAKIHIAASQLGLRDASDDSAYRDMLWSIGRVRSAKDLDAGGRQAVLKHLRGCGFKDRPQQATRYERGTPAALIRLIWTALADAGVVRDRSDRALRRYIGQHSSANPDFRPEEIAPQHLDAEQARMVIEQLKRWCSRAKVDFR